MRSRRLLALAIAACGLIMPALADAPSSPYAGQQARTVKALSAEEIASLLKGDGMGLAKAAELNGYPGPKHVLDLSDQLRLTEGQRQQVQDIFDRMSAAAKPLGAELVEREQALDQLFARNEITVGRLVAETTSIAELQGRLRSVHLTAHVETKALLNADQIIRYQQLRGYGNPAVPIHHHQHG